jgi:integrase
MVPFRAALNKVLAPGAPNTEADWQSALRPIADADRQRTLYLDRNQRRALIEHTDDEGKPLLTAMCLLPLRPGVFAALDAGDFDKRTGQLVIGQDKTGPVTIVLPPATSAFFAEQTKDKLPNAPIFMRADGGRWDRTSWKRPITSAAKAAELPDGVVAYTLRHSGITDLIVIERLSLFEAAKVSNTSVEMVEKYYGHFDRQRVSDALAGLAL